MISQEFRKRAHRGNPLHLSNIGVMSEAFGENPAFDHVFSAWKFSSMGTWKNSDSTEIPAEATVAVADTAAKTKKIARGIARTALIDHKFDPAEVTFETKDGQHTNTAVDVYIRALPPESSSRVIE